MTMSLIINEYHRKMQNMQSIYLFSHLHKFRRSSISQRPFRHPLLKTSRVGLRVGPFFVLRRAITCVRAPAIRNFPISAYVGPKPDMANDQRTA